MTWKARDPSPAPNLANTARAAQIHIVFKITTSNTAAAASATPSLLRHAF